ncbi:MULTISPECIES: hypothetical protein [unclassified Halomonas]|uniref:hypothetical protein n=1 Tax=unclassified Halomonas TaxID=2609666 RepID=UPI0021E50893|nr:MULTISPECIES: hypothetical protein [unclassified Halomonas]UYF98625.1 hypothetical protein OCT39_10300 [Halomonas sp. GD1P12]WNL40261.1 hypothetical protein RN346_06775 [Halomonas sp. PAMB 3232]
MDDASKRRPGVGILLVASLVGAGLALYAYLTPLTGVTGTLGALTALFGCIALAVAALLLFKWRRGAGAIALRVLALIGLLGTGFAALLLHQWWLCAVLILGLLGLLIDTFSRSSSSTSDRR